MAATPVPVVPVSILDTDLGKLCMQQAVFHHFPDVQSLFRFTRRDDGTPFSKEATELLRRSIDGFSRLSLSAPEFEWLRSSFPYFGASYLEYLNQYRFKPEQVKITFRPLSDDPNEDKGYVDIEATGPWLETILWEAPLIACLSEVYFKVVDTDWDYHGQAELAYFKGKSLFQADCTLNEFGTRRRRSFLVQDLVVENLAKAAKDSHGKGKFAGTSNVHLAHKHSVAAVDTIAHEWFMGVAAIKGYEHANYKAMELWEEVYPNSLLIALTDTFSTETFYKDFIANSSRVQRWMGLRQDSGDPFVYAPRAKEIYTGLGIGHRSKTIMYSDWLNIDKAVRLKAQCDEIGFVSSFGIGTFLTNDFNSISSGRKEKSKTLNMVMKLASVNGNPCVKIGDELMKNTGDQATVLKAKKIFGINT